MSGNEKATQARTAIMGVDPGLAEAIDALKGTFGAKLVSLRVGALVFGSADRSDAEWEAAAPYVRYQRPGEVSEEWKEIKAAIAARVTAGKRATSRKR